jgi:poly-gamma-glutamate capsule biosynthesis protein CapA/YwtB (metallophosphatase superfamily)
MRIVLVGDVMLGRLVNDVLKEKPPAYPWGDTLPLFQAADFRFCNLECVLADQGTPWSATPKVFHFRSDAKNIQVLQAAQITAVSLANNHVLDFQEAALFEMLQLLDERGIQHAGAGHTLAEAAQPALMELNGQKIGLLAFTNNEPVWAATEEQPGVYYIPIDVQDQRAKCLFEQVHHFKQCVDYLIVSAHWGPNWGYKPPSAHPPFAHAMIEAGADLIVGHSGHVFRGIEFYHGRPILYCLGNFIDDYAVDPLERNDQGCLASLELEGTTLSSLRLYPTMIQDCHARQACREEARAIASMLQRLSARFKTALTWDEAEGALEWRPESERYSMPSTKKSTQ